MVLVSKLGSMKYENYFPWMVEVNSTALSQTVPKY